MNDYLINKLKEGRLNKGFKQSDVTKLTGIKNTTLSNYENGVTEPDIDTFLQLCEIYELDYAGILGEAYGLTVQGTDFEVKPSEIEHIKKYRSLDPYGQETISFLLDREVERAEMITEKQNKIEELETFSPWEQNSHARIIHYYQKLASAGTGQIVFDNIPTEQISIPDVPEYKSVSYSVGVNGDSMMPLYLDGDKLLVERTNNVSVGEVGIFIKGNEAFVKKLGDGVLTSVNKKYPNIPITRDTRCLGRVIDKIRERSSVYSPLRPDKECSYSLEEIS